jgi:ABC-type sugar transport system substrate-binding protein
MKKHSSVFAVSAVAGALALMVAGPASASITEGSWSGPHSTSDSYGVLFDLPTATAASITFNLAGYLSLDGYNKDYTDVFSLTVNGKDVFVGMFDMGGGGISMATNGATWTSTSNGSWNGGSATVSLPISLIAGENKIKFSYSSPCCQQSITDEAWGVDHFSVTAVPEPETYAMMLAGLGMVGVIGRRRRKA